MNVSNDGGVKEDPLKLEKTNDENKDDDTIEDEFHTLDNLEPKPESDHVDPQEDPINDLSKKKLSLDECDLKKYKNLTDFVNSLFTKIENNKARCNICGKESRRPQIYRAHAESHIQGLKFPCKNCDFICGTRQTLQTHIKACSIIKQIQGMSKSENGGDNHIDTTTLTHFLDKSSQSGNAGCWKCVTKLPDGRVKCNFCPVTLTMHSGSTSTVNRHLQVKHSDEPAVKDLIESLTLKEKIRKTKNKV